MMKKILSLVLCFAMCLGVAACGTQTAPASSSTAPPTGSTSAKGGGSEGTIKIGVWEPITGSMAGAGALRLEGIQLANEQRPTVLGKTVELIYADNKSDTVEAANAMQRLVDRGDIVGILGTMGSSLAMAGLDISERAEIPVLAGASNPLVTKDRSWVSRTSLADPFGGRVMAKFAAEELGIKNVVIVQNIGEDYSIGMTNFFTEAFCSYTGQSADDAILGTVNYNSGDTDFTAQLNTIKSLQPEAIFFPGYYNEGALFCIQMRQLGLDIPFLGTDGMEAPDLVTVGGDAVEGIYISSQFSMENENPKTVQFVKDFNERWGENPSMTAAVGYNNYNAMLDAIEAAGNEYDNKAIEQYLRNLSDWEGVTGTINVDPATGEAYVACPILQVKGGLFTLVKYIDVSDLLK